MVELTQNVKLDTDNGVIYVDFEKATDVDKQVVSMNNLDGKRIVLPMPVAKKKEKSTKRVAAGKKNNGKTAEQWLALLKTEEQRAEFKRLNVKPSKGEKNVGYWAAVIYAKHELGMK